MSPYMKSILPYHTYISLYFFVERAAKALWLFLLKDEKEKQVLA